MEQWTRLSVYLIVSGNFHMSINFFPEVFMRIQLRQHQKQLISLAGAILKESSLNTGTTIGVNLEH